MNAVTVPPKSAGNNSMNESLERPDMLIGSTYKLKCPLLDHAVYVTINDILLHEGTSKEIRRPYEIFLNSKNIDQHQWVTALTRVISAVFRKGGDLTFLVEEMKAVFDPKGGYWKPGGVFVPSLVAEIGMCIEKHFVSIGLIKDKEAEKSGEAPAAVVSDEEDLSLTAGP